MTVTVELLLRVTLSTFLASIVEAWLPEACASDSVHVVLSNVSVSSIVVSMVLSLEFDSAETVDSGQVVV